MRATNSSLKKVLAVPFAQYTADKTDATPVDLRGYDSAEFTLITAAVSTASGGNTFTLKLFHGDASDGSDATEVDSSLLLGSAVVDATGDANSVIGTIAYLGNKRYVRAVLDETGTADAVMGVVAVLGHAHLEPVA